MKKQEPTHVIVSNSSAYCGEKVAVVGTTYGGTKVQVRLVERKQPKMITLNVDSIRPIQKEFALTATAGTTEKPDQSKKRLYAIEAYPEYSVFNTSQEALQALLSEDNFTAYLAHSIEHAIKQYEKDFGEAEEGYMYVVACGDGEIKLVTVQIERKRTLVVN